MLVSCGGKDTPERSTLAGPRSTATAGPEAGSTATSTGSTPGGASTGAAPGETSTDATDPPTTTGAAGATTTTEPAPTSTGAGPATGTGLGGAGGLQALGSDVQRGRGRAVRRDILALGREFAGIRRAVQRLSTADSRQGRELIRQLRATEELLQDQAAQPLDEILTPELLRVLSARFEKVTAALSAFRGA